MSLRVWLIGGLIVYFVVLLLVGFVNNRNKDRRAYFLNSNKTPYWILSTSFVAAWFGGNSALISVDESFTQGLGGWWVLGGPTVVAVVVMFFFARRIRQLGMMTQNGIVAKRYNQTAGNILSGLFIIFFITWAASQMVAIGSPPPPPSLRSSTRPTSQPLSSPWSSLSSTPHSAGSKEW
jgi:SSS family solute:Na+ symporter